MGAPASQVPRCGGIWKAEAGEAGAECRSVKDEEPALTNADLRGGGCRQLPAAH